jgi:hypothetical protein
MISVVEGKLPMARESVKDERYSIGRYLPVTTGRK